MKVPARPSLDSLKTRLDKGRATGERLTRDGFLRETFVLPREAARTKAREWFDQFPKAAYWTQVESWRVLDGDVIEFTMRRLPTAD